MKLQRLGMVDAHCDAAPELPGRWEPYRANCLGILLEAESFGDIDATEMEQNSTKRMPCP